VPDITPRQLRRTRVRQIEYLWASAIRTFFTTYTSSAEVAGRFFTVGETLHLGCSAFSPAASTAADARSIGIERQETEKNAALSYSACAVIASSIIAAA
jgi:hypothetical protein